MWVLSAADRMEGDKRRTPLPLLVVVSGKTTITLCEFFLTSSERSTACSGEDGRVKHDASARSRDIGCTLRDAGKLWVKIGSKMAAR